MQDDKLAKKLLTEEVVYYQDKLLMQIKGRDCRICFFKDDVYNGNELCNIENCQYHYR
jgi:hypothetical protein